MVRRPVPGTAQNVTVDAHDWLRSEVLGVDDVPTKRYKDCGRLAHVGGAET